VVGEGAYDDMTSAASPYFGAFFEASYASR
jgi:hypothetical protein